MLAIANAANANVVIAPDVSGDVDVDVDLEQVPWRAALDGAAAALGAEVVGTGDVLVIRRPVAVNRSRVSIKFNRMAVSEVFDMLAKLHRWNVVIDAAVKASVTVQTPAKEIVVRDVAQAIATAGGAELSEQGGIMRIEPVLTSASKPLQLRGEQMGVQELRELTKARTACEVTVPAEDAAKLWLFVPTARADAVWRAVALATGRRLVTDQKGWRLE